MKPPMWMFVSTFIFAYSTKLNPRRLEAPFYMFWNTVLVWFFQMSQCGIVVAPQYSISYSKDEIGKPGSRHDEDNPCANSTDDEAEYQVQDSSFQTITGRPDYERVPDFTFIAPGFIYERSNPQHALDPRSISGKFSQWSSKKARGGGPVGFCEVKRPPSRSHLTREGYNNELVSWMDLAKSDLEVDVRLAFLARDRHRRKYVLVAMVAHYFCWKIARRENYNIPGPSSDSNPDSSPQSDPDSDPDYNSDSSEEINAFLTLPKNMGKEVDTKGKTREVADPESIPSESDSEHNPEDTHKGKRFQSPVKNKAEGSKTMGIGKKIKTIKEMGKPGVKTRGMEKDSYKAKGTLYKPYPQLMQKLGTKAEDALPKNGSWSGFIEFGSEISEQQLSLIKQHLTSPNL